MPTPHGNHAEKTNVGVEHRMRAHADRGRPQPQAQQKTQTAHAPAKTCRGQSHQPQNSARAQPPTEQGKKCRSQTGGEKIGHIENALPGRLNPDFLGQGVALDRQ